MGVRGCFARLGTRLADRSHGSGYKDPDPGTWRRFLLIPEKWHMQFCFLDPLTVLGLNLLVKGLSHVVQWYLANHIGYPCVLVMGHSPTELFVLDGGVCASSNV